MDLLVGAGQHSQLQGYRALIEGAATLQEASMHGYDPRELSSRRTAMSRMVDREIEDRRHESEDGFLGSLFDTSFESSITPKIIRASYVIFMLIDGLFVIVILAAGFGNFLVRLIAATFVFFALLIWVRLGFETMMTLHNIEKYTRRTARMADTFSAIERNTRTAGGRGD